MNVFAGMILAELSFMPQPSGNSTLTTVIPYPLAVFGLYLCSFPTEYADQARWSRQLQDLGNRIFPERSDLGRVWPAVGAEILCLAILYSPRMRNAFCAPWLIWLGGLSYPIYLLHGTFIRTVLTWLAFGPGAIWLWLRALDDGSLDSQSLIPRPSNFTLTIVLPIFAAILLAGVHLWVKNVEPLLGLATARFENFAQSWGKDTAHEGPTRLNGSVLPR
jgi:hypothetical protein